MKVLPLDGARLLVDDNQQVTRTQKLAEWDPYTLPIITERAGKVGFATSTQATEASGVTGVKSRTES